MQPDAGRHRVAQHPVRAERAAAAHELDAGPSAETLPGGNGNEADGARARDVRAAAGRQVEALDVDEAQHPFAARFLPERKPGRFGRIREPDGNGTVFPNDPVRFVLDLLDPGWRDIA